MKTTKERVRNSDRQGERRGGREKCFGKWLVVWRGKDVRRGQNVKSCGKNRNACQKVRVVVRPLVFRKKKKAPLSRSVVNDDTFSFCGPCYCGDVYPWLPEKERSINTILSQKKVRPCSTPAVSLHAFGDTSLPWRCCGKEYEIERALQIVRCRGLFSLRLQVPILMQFLNDRSRLPHKQCWFLF